MSIEFLSAPKSRVSGVPPTAVLFQRSFVKASVSAGSDRVLSLRKAISSGFRGEIDQRCVGCVSGVGCVSVKCKVASPLRSRASAFGPDHHGPESVLPRQILEGTLQNSRRAAAALKFERLQRRLAGKTGSGVQRWPGVELIALRQVASSAGASSGGVALLSPEYGPVSVASVASVVSSSSAFPSSRCRVPLRTCSSAGPHSEIECVMSKVASVASGVRVVSRELVASSSVQSVASQSVVSKSVVPQSVMSVSRAPVGQFQSDVGEWRQVGDASSSVLARVRAVVEASARLSSVNQDRSRMH